MRKKIVAGNWKMHKTLPEAIELVSELKNKLQNFQPACDVIIFPPFVNLESVSELLKDSPIHLGAQNMHFEESGAFTGEISADMLKSVGAEFVIIGHSERRHIFNEPDEWINEKVKRALKKGLKPILCIGEKLEEREEGLTEKVLRRQVIEGLKGISSEAIKNIVIAYEPVWAIGTGKTAAPQEADSAHAFVRAIITELYDSDVAQSLTIQYGGSVKPNNAKDLLSQPNIDGALVGGACLKADSFIEIIKSA